MSQSTILIVDDDADIRFALRLLLQQANYKVVEAESPVECEQILQRLIPSLILLDMNFTQDTTSGQEGLELLDSIIPNGIPVILMTAWANIQLAVSGIQNGASDFIEKPWKKSHLLKQIQHHLNDQKTATSHSNELWITESSKMQALQALVQQLAKTDANLLILGENGTGKSLLAQRIHQLSQRHSGELITLNMAAITETLFESELFGHQKGAFTDAKHSRDGAFTRAHNGTLFMDEIGSLPINLQPKLLQVLETGVYAPVGGEQTQVDTRLIAATNQDLIKGIEQGDFRQDLYYRLNTFVITLPPLRERQADIIPLSKAFIRVFIKKYNKAEISLSEAVITQLTGYQWPGNVRELRNIIERAVLMCNDTVITPQHILLTTEPNNQVNTVPELTLAELEQTRINAALEKHQGNISQAATELGISRNALYRRLEKYDDEG